MKLKLTALFIGLLAIIFALLPWLFVQVADWQKAFNQLISENLHQIQAHSSTAGLWLIFAAFSYGVLHALGPGHGKFIIAGYLSTHESQLKTSVRLSLLSSLMQGFVAVAATSIVVVILNLSSKYFKLSQLWLERSALILLVLLGIYWIAQGLKGLKKKQSFRITSIQSLPKQIGTASPFRYEQGKVSQTQCSCGHQHLPNHQQLKQSGDLKSQLLVQWGYFRALSCLYARSVLVGNFSYVCHVFGYGINAFAFCSVSTLCEKCCDSIRPLVWFSGV